MKGYILKNRPFKYCLLLVVESCKKGQAFECIYRGFHNKKDAITFYETNGDNMLCVYDCIYKRDSIFVNVNSAVINFLSKTL